MPLYANRVATALEAKAAAFKHLDRELKADLQRLQLVRQIRLLGLGLPEVKQLVDQAFTSECGAFAGQLLDRLQDQQRAVSQRIAELEALRDQLDLLAEHVRHCRMEAQPGQLATDCGFCPLIDEEGGTKC